MGDQARALPLNRARCDEMLSFELRPIRSLTPHESARMYALMEAHYQGLTPAIFERDLSFVQVVCLLRCSDLVIRGFTTMAVNPRGCAQGDETILYSGDTIIDPTYWGSQALVRGVCETVGRLVATWPERRLFWYLTSKGHRTYMYLPLFTKRYYPAVNPERNAAELVPRLRRVSERLYPEYWDEKRGVLSGRPYEAALKTDLAQATFDRRANRHVAHFLRLNPGFEAGEELVCLAEGAASNLRSAARTHFTRGSTSPFGARERLWWCTR